MIVDKNAQLFDGVTDASQAFFEPRNNGLKCVDLNQVQEFLLALDVVIQPGERNATRAADVAYRSSLVTFIAECLGGMPQDHLQFLLRLALRHRRSWHKGDAGSVRTFVR